MGSEIHRDKKGLTMTSYCSLLYLGIFLPGVILGYQLSPRKLRPYVLLAASYVFFWEFSGKLLLYLLFTTLSMYLFGLAMAGLQKKRGEQVAALKTQGLPKDELKEARKAIKARSQKRQRLVMLAAVLIQLGILSVLKYSAFFLANWNSLSTHCRPCLIW